MTKRIRKTLLAVLCGLCAVCLLFGALWLRSASAEAAEAETAERVTRSTVGIHDPSIVVGYEGSGGGVYPSADKAGANAKKVYYVFGTNLAIAKSYDLENWTNVKINGLNTNFPKLRADLNATSTLNPRGGVAEYSGLTDATIEGNLWAPDVVWNPTMNKWCMYLSVNGASYNSSIVLLTADTLNGTWTYIAPVVYSGFGWGSNQTDLTDYKAVTGNNNVPEKFNLQSNNGSMFYGMNAIDACILFDGDNLYMTYGSWFGGIYMLELDPATGLRKQPKYTDIIEGTVSTSSPFTAYVDEYMGIHIAGGNSVTGEGSYIQKIGDYYYLFMSYGGYAPKGGYNMRVFRSETITGYTGNDVSSKDNFEGYKDVGGITAMVVNSETSHSEDRGGQMKVIWSRDMNGQVGLRLMSGYQWSWLDYGFVAQGHNSAFVDPDDGRIYLVYHNKFVDGTDHHVMKVHEMFQKDDGWLVTAPFEWDHGDEIATGLTQEQLNGDWGTIFMTRNNGTFENPLHDAKATVNNAKITGLGYIDSRNADKAEDFTYDPATGELTITRDGYNYKGYVLRQKIEGTNLSTLAFAVSSTDGTYSAYTYWGYKYPSATAAAQYFATQYAAVQKIGDDVAFPQPCTLWGTTLEMAEVGDKIVVKANGTATSISTEYDVTSDIAQYADVKTGQAFLPLGFDSVDDVTISFDYANYESDWTPVLYGNNFRIYLSVLSYNNGRADGETVWGECLEAAATSSNGGAWNSFFNTGRVTIAFKSDGSVTFSKGGTLLLTYPADTAFGNGSTATTVGELNRAVREAFQNGMVRAEYPMTNVTISAHGSYAAEDLPIAPDDDSIHIYHKHAGSAANMQLNAGVFSDISTGGVAFSMKTNAEAGDRKDWSANVVEQGAMKITLPNLDAWGEAGDLAQTNLFPNFGENKNYKNGGAWDSFLGNECFTTISIATTGIRYYKNGVLLVEYLPTDVMQYNNNSASAQTTVGTFIAAFLNHVETFGCTVLPTGTTATGTDLIVTNALDEAQAAELYTAYDDIVSCETAGHRWSEWTTVREATCTGSGIRTRHCTVDGQIDREEIPAGHEWSEWTLNENGDEERTCDICGEQETRTTAKVTSFRTQVAAVSSASTLEAKLTAIRTALTTYGTMQAAEKTKVASEYATLEGAIASYNDTVQALNTAHKSAQETAAQTLGAAIAAVGALAAVWFVLKQGL